MKQTGTQYWKCNCVVSVIASKHLIFFPITLGISGLQNKPTFDKQLPGQMGK